MDYSSVKNSLLLFSCSFIFNFCADGQITFFKVYGGIDTDGGQSAIQTSDGGYLTVGYTATYTNGNLDIYIIKTNLYGDTLWTRTYGGYGDQEGYWVTETRDGNYIIAGVSYNTMGPSVDPMLVKINTNGDTLWTRVYGGGGNYQQGNSVQETYDGGFMMVGYTIAFSSGDKDVYLIRTDSAGNLLSTKTFGGPGLDQGVSIQPTFDGGFIVGGSTTSFDGGNQDYYLIKTDMYGDTLWTKIVQYGSGGSTVQTRDSGFIIAGSIYGIGAGSDDAYVIKVNANGLVEWNKTFGTTDALADQAALSVRQTNDGGFIIVGYTASYIPGDADVYLIKTDENGDTLWTRTIGVDTYHDWAFSVEQTSDSGFIIGGRTAVFFGSFDTFLIKTDKEGHVGCHEKNFQTVITTPSTHQTLNTTTIQSSGGAANYPLFYKGHGAMVYTGCSSVNVPEDESYSALFSISPNPANSAFTITTTTQLQNAQLEIFNLLGEKIYSAALNSKQQTINCEYFPKGIYFVKLQSDPEGLGGSAMQKLVVQ